MNTSGALVRPGYGIAHALVGRKVVGVDAVAEVADLAPRFPAPAGGTGRPRAPRRTATRRFARHAALVARAAGAPSRRYSQVIGQRFLRPRTGVHLSESTSTKSIDAPRRAVRVGVLRHRRREHQHARRSAASRTRRSTQRAQAGVAVVVERQRPVRQQRRQAAHARHAAASCRRNGCSRTAPATCRHVLPVVGVVDEGAQVHAVARARGA